MKDTNCPYCNADVEIDHDEGYGYDESEVHNQECDSCGKTFTYTTSISFWYETEKAECMNGDPHDWEPTKTYPECFVKMKCPMCSQERDPNQEERKKFSIPTYDEWQELNKTEALASQDDR